MFLKTKRLTLKDLSREDFVKLATDPSVMAFSTKGTMSQQQAESYFEQLTQKMKGDPRYGIWAIFKKDREPSCYCQPQPLGALSNSRRSIPSSTLDKNFRKLFL
jgi:RimJ/RimL family protein N-acetyltransferase